MILKLSDKQKAFADAFLASHSAGEALKIAGYVNTYAERILESPAVQAYLLGKNPNIFQEHGELQLSSGSVKNFGDNPQPPKRTATPGDIYREIADLEEVAAHLSAFMRGENGADGKAPTIKDQLKAAELLGKSYGMFDRDVSGSACPPVFTDDEQIPD